MSILRMQQGDGILTMATQVKYFANTASAVKQVYGPTLAKTYLEKSLVVVSTTNNDLSAYYIATGAAEQNQNKKFIADLVKKFTEHLKVVSRSP